LLRELGIEHDVSSCSYIDKGIAYLEEDCDMSLFLAKFKEQLSDVELNIHEIGLNSEAFVRNLHPYPTQ
ncbi:MAG: hypothetical protein GY815_07290, partial [Gammaproteobacteria bacterium]|nr:hypothetical protein [Gammaproteobacteria bacterium]